MTQTVANKKPVKTQMNTLERARQKFFDTLPKRIKCQTCEQTRKKEAFGVRLMNKPEVESKGVKPKFLVQARCTTCRH